MTSHKHCYENIIAPAIPSGGDNYCVRSNLEKRRYCTNCHNSTAGLEQLYICPKHIAVYTPKYADALLAVEYRDTHCYGAIQ